MLRLLPLILLSLLAKTLASPFNHQIHSAFPATRWEDAMLSGNGLSGVMQYGGQPKETLIFNNHKFLRPGNGRDPIPDMSDMMAIMRKKMLGGDLGGGWKLFWDEWQKRAKTGLIWTQQFHPGYQMHIDFVGGSYPVKYKRSTQYDTGEISVEFTDGFGDWQRNTFVSRAHDVIVTRLSQSSGGLSVNATLSLAPCEKHQVEIKYEVIPEDGWLTWRAKYPERKKEQGGYEGVTRIVLPKGGRLKAAKNGKVYLTGCPEILLITALDRYRADYKEWEKDPLKKKLSALPADYRTLLAEHVAIHKPIYERVSYSLGATEEERSQSTEQLIAAENADKSTIYPALLERLFYTSRYLFMASSGEHYAPRLSGIFIGRWGAAWAGDYTMDANANMAVLGGHIGNMPECMRGYQAIIERTLPQWRAGAKQLYGMRGMLGPVRIDGEVGVPHHFNHYHAHPTATGLGPWIIYPLWEQYEITGDKEFLRKTLYPIMKELLLFYEDFLTEKDAQGKLIFVPSNSPENAWRGVEPRSSAAINSTMDISACRQLLTNILKAEKDLGLTLSTKAQEFLKNLPPYLVNKDGALQEWSWPGHGENYGHRHSSHMYVVWPGYDINPENPETKHLVPNVIKALEKRNHRIIQAHDFIQRAIAWLRVKQAEPFYDILKYTLESNYLFSSLATSHDLNHHIYNFDYILSLQGMLIENAVFSQPGLIELLPAMPKALKKGEFTGLKGRNRCTIDHIAWDLEAKTVDLTVTSDIDQTLTLIIRPGIKKPITLKAGKTQSFNFSL